VIRLGWLAAAVLGAFALDAAAQTAPPRIVPSDRPDQARPQATPSRPPLAAPPRAARGPAAFTPFVLREVVVAGSSLPAATLDAAWRPFAGRTIDAAGLQAVTDAIAAAYADADYALYTVAVEPQDFAGGTLRVRVVEGRIAGVDIQAPPAARVRPLVESYGRRLQAETPLRRSTLERYVSLIRDIPGAQPTLDLRAGDAEGEVRLQAVLDPDPVQAAITVNNRGTAFLGRTQVQGDLFLNSMLRAGDQTRLTVAVPTHTRLFQFYALQHVEPIGSDGLTASASLSHLRTKPEGTDLTGHATAAGLQFGYPIQRSYNQDIYVTVGLDGVDNENSFLGFTFADDRTRAIRAAAAFSRRSERRLAYASASFSQGLDFLGARRTDPGLSELDFRKLNGRAGASFAVGARAAVRLNAAGQWTSDRLPATEQFALGGDEFGRAYEASVVAGDKGAAGSVELAYAPALPAPLAGSEAYAFADAGKVWFRPRFGNPTRKADLASAGAGVRAKVADRLLLQLEAARALGTSQDLLERDHWRGVFLVKAVF
jgi:hemolysin activation/secretion protein